MKGFLSILLFSSLFFAFTGVFADKDTCPKACSAYKSCTLMKHKTATDEQLKKFEQGCMNACKKNTSAVDACYKKSGADKKLTENQCVSYYNCIVSAYQSKAK
jgi:Cys-rich protein (TIGR04453 family)